MKLTCYVTSTSPWFLYAASVSLCFFFFARNSRVTVASPLELSCYCGVDQPCKARPITSSSLRQSLAIHHQIWRKPSGADHVPDKFADVTVLCRAKKVHEGSDEEKSDLWHDLPFMLAWNVISLNWLASLFLGDMMIGRDKNWNESFCQPQKLPLKILFRKQKMHVKLIYFIR